LLESGYSNVTFEVNSQIMARGISHPKLSKTNNMIIPCKGSSACIEILISIINEMLWLSFVKNK